ncbi:hypothetical protein SAMN04489712_104351 [Thermomonospora echinospora]|uniref:Regulatory protein n=1 Tax=Thermomonospora echinospora TaxID=1992 RepID=A0A1H5Z419_9ACTN|nr:hypothetical protein [Thermomonospora echinospora]SEG31309.1 hypothetical protein SAMN04489712_104351 [Thermomonospora echinospora]
MRNMPIDTTNLAFVCVSPPRPKLVNQETGEIKMDKNGDAVYQVGLSCSNAEGRVDLLTVQVTGDPGVTLGQVVTPVGLVGFFWEQTINGERRSGVSFRAERVVPVGAENAAAA